jgi:KDO2-lipid IV(A) lauroyltransferase
MRRRVKDSLYVAALNTFSSLTGVFPQLGEACGSLTYRIARAEAERARGNIGWAFPEMHEDDVGDLARACFRNIGAALTEVLRFDALNADNIADHVDIRGIERVHAALEGGRGCIMVTAHYGNWEMFAAGLALSGFPVTPIVRELRSHTLDRWIDGRRRLVGLTPASRQSSLRRAVEALKANEVVLMLPDVDTAVRGVFVDFFGQLAHTPVGPALLSARYGAPILTGFLTRRPGGRHLSEIGEPLAAPSAASSDDALTETTAAVAARIEAQIRRHPEQWIWMHRRWRTQPGDLG